jgi:hypothetical protein
MAAHLLLASDQSRIKNDLADLRIVELAPPLFILRGLREVGSERLRVNPELFGLGHRLLDGLLTVLGVGLDGDNEQSVGLPVS